MDKRDIASQAERYKQEMMRLYGRSTVPAADKTEAVPAVNTRPETEKLPEAPSEPGREIQTEPSDTTSAEEKPVEERYPEPDLSELSTDLGQISKADEMIRPEYASEESMGTAKGYILVNVRTGTDAEPVQNASVKVTAIVNGNRLIIASGVTNNSGITPKFEVPVPDISYSQAPDPAIRPYSLYDISVTAEGFFNARSVDVPAFEGITSVQNFSMIPVPLFMKANEETVTYFNQEPNL
ncbi:MAG: carboxypeptidase regulatory-like domain-containing protein [Ruminococcus sp.]|nr:carboxypeptidase regulatory-like domain-containing protein [Ruminococcus sp.]